MSKSKKKTSPASIVVNRQARHDFFIEDKLEAGVVLEGWEVKSLREGKVQINESHVILRDGEAFILGSLITPLPTASTHITPDATRTRKLLLHQKELSKLIGLVQRKGYTLVPLALYWKRGKVKAEIGIARGKKQHDKRAVNKERDWEREKARIMKKG